ncbi:DUF4188 domain-containing protein [Rhodococcus erythropolis]|uniref:DUF4188 domain-containing protein n=1 Tax=Rhodococcus erythropolis TaxID=1833 RepID=UPI001290F798|nr:DUF4188 domain-containing protein [Rhodococcus erythropolis]MQP33626.1 DUF4188 domain-containing protein [Rhodococcus erythropolis]
MARSRVQTGRYTAEIDDDFVVFLIGIRINKLWKIHKWIGPFFSMPRMLRELRLQPDKGMLGARIALGGHTFTVVQYWRSFDQLEAFAKNPNDPHLPAWKAFNTKVGASGDVGVYHETYRVGAGRHESIYSNMPVMGLAAAGRSVVVGKRSETARARIATQ